MKDNIRTILAALSVVKLAAVYNELNKKVNPSAKAIKKFASTEKGMERLEDLAMVNEPELEEVLVELGHMEGTKKAPAKKAAKKAPAKKAAKKAPAKKAAKKAPAKKAAKKEASTGSRSQFSRQATIHKLCKENPRREGSHGHESWKAIEPDGCTIEQFQDNGGRRADLMWDYKLGGRVDIREPQTK